MMFSGRFSELSSRYPTTTRCSTRIKLTDVAAQIGEVLGLDLDSDRMEYFVDYEVEWYPGDSHGKSDKES